MEMEFKDPDRRRRILLVVVGVLLAAAAGWGAFMLANGKTAAVDVETAHVLVAARDIAARQPVNPDDVVLREVPVDDILSQAYDDSSLVLGRLTAVPVYADQQMTPNLFATMTADADYSILGPDEEVTANSPLWRAVSVQIPNERAVGGTLKAGQRVDVLISVEFEVYAVDPEGTYMRVDTATAEGLQSGTSTKITIQDVEVLKADPDANMYVLKVDLHEAEQIAQIVAIKPDAMALALRPETDTRPANVAEYGETIDSIVMRYMFRVPQLADLSELLGQDVTPTIPSQPETPSPTPDRDAEQEPDSDAEPAEPESPDDQASPNPSPAL